MSPPPEPYRDWGEEMHAAAEKHIAACHEAEEEELPDSPACAPFDGCDTCLIRETLHAAWPLVEEYAEHVMRLTEARRDAGIPEVIHLPPCDEGDPWTSPLPPQRPDASTDASPAP